jgi:glycosidase
MNRCNKALYDEYPKMTMFGETWVHGTANQAYFTANVFNTPFKSNLTGATDFQTLFYGIFPAIKDNFGWTDGVNKLYTTLSNDFLYKNAGNNCIFLDNHDLTRIATELGGDVNKVKFALAWLYTCRGIPQLYYGTEVFMKGDKGINDGQVRLDFPGGWDGDAKNAFTGNNLTAEEKDMQDYLKKLGNFRKNSSAIKTGKMMQYLPVDGLYVYFRYDNNQTVMCIMNTAKEDKKLNFSEYIERTKGFTKATSITGNDQYKTNETPTIPAGHMWVLQLEK